MHGSLRRLIPSMFHRRLLLLATAALVVSVGLGLQLVKLTVVQGAEYREQAERALRTQSYIPTVRGQIRDRRERVLAGDEPSYDVAVNYVVLTGEWVYHQALTAARRTHRAQWAQWSLPQRDQAITQYQADYEQQLEDLLQSLCEFGAIERSELEERVFAIRGHVQQLAGTVYRNWQVARERETDEPVSMADVVRPIAEQVAPHTLLRDISDAARLQLMQRVASADEQRDSIWRQVTIQDSKARRYPLETLTVVVPRDTFPGALRHSEAVEISVSGVGFHLLGSMRGLWADDYRDRPFSVDDLGGYRPGDTVGSWGIERSQERVLRGVRGQVIYDREGRQISRREPVAGRDVLLSLDIQLQARVQALMSHDERVGLMRRQPWHAADLPGPVGEPLNGAAVVLDVSSGQVLAAVTVPEMTPRQLREQPRSVFGDRVNMPYLNRTVAARYVPGSTLKPLVMLGHDTEMGLSRSVTIDCIGHFYRDRSDRLRCWIHNVAMVGHGPADGVRAMCVSCNVYFYTLGHELGSRRLVTWLQHFGLGQLTGCGLPEEIRGYLPDLARAADPNAVGFRPEEAILMGIGQGPVAWTPLQAANAYATIARRGYAITPTFFKVASVDYPQRTTDLGLSQRSLDEVMQGLYDAVHSAQGTGHHINRERIFNVPGVKVYGKSGTADPGIVWIDLNHDGARQSNELFNPGDHAWFVALVRRDGSPRADFVVAVVVEYAGSGGRAAGPIVNQIIWALRAERYL
jgi:penicillin-binding protein 2